ncbi:toll-like receptor 7 [Sitodiplosis mosellana]|uniref:toll-like receptor 7 n=1 Tax=Sitodiplosis mosellana TaxID=263140 RepID=UPI0024453991|nr:toll-like receptor 7 [Sitodiplosis mosellana]
MYKTKQNATLAMAQYNRKSTQSRQTGHFVQFVLMCMFVPIALVQSTTNTECTWQTYGQSIMCFMRTIDNASAIDFSDVDGTATTSTLSIHCDNTVLDESVIAAGFFHKLDNLEQIIIDGCKLLHLINGSFTGLRNLRRIDIETRNSEWGDGNKLEIDNGIFVDHPNVNDIKLTQNNLRAIPYEILCPLKSLESLNISHNRIGSLNDSGYTCGNGNRNLFNELKMLDISHNQLVSIDGDWTESNLSQLKELRLQHNNLTKIASGAFHGMHSLTHLNLSYNQLESLPTDMLNDTKKLQELHLQNNKLYQLPSALFRDLPELMVLDLSSNQLSSHYIDSWIFSGADKNDDLDMSSSESGSAAAGLKRLVVLNLANNALTRIESHFKTLNFLQVLDLRNNSIGIVHERAFSALNNLHTLNLSGNRLHIIGAGLFNGLHVLNRLVLSNNLITLIDTRAFRNCTSLKELDLSSNQLTDVPASVRDLKMLKSLDLGENRISVLRNESFENMSQLTGLRLMDNLISNITNGIFYPLRGLHVLNLAKNKIQSIERGAFDKNNEIEAIRLDKNLLTDINGIFATLNSLLWLNLSENQLVWFDYAFIPMNLKWLDIHSNFIEALGNYYRLQPEITVTTLDASHNRITEIGSLSVPNSIELFFVNNNLIRNVYPNTFIDKQNLTRVDLYSNAITKLHLHALRISAMASMKKNTEFYLSGNPFECDCSMGWLRNINDMSGTQQHQHPRIMDYESIECLVTHTRNTPVRLLSSLSADEFLCRYESKCPASCHCCEHTKCYCNIKCPDNCACFHDQSGAINKINCGKQNALQIPERVPMDATDLYLDGNNFFDLQSNVFNKLRHLRSLYLNSSNVISIQPHAFNGLNTNLQRLHLEDNKLTALYGNEFNTLYHLKELYLQNNLLTYIENTTFHSLKYLQILRLDGNRLTALTAYQMHSPHLRNLKTLTLSRNLWSCSCSFLQEFIPFVWDSNVVVTDSNSIHCVEDGAGAAIDTINGNEDQHKGRKLLIDRNLTNECKNLLNSPINNVLVLPPEGIPHGYIPLMAFILIIFFILAVLVAIFTIKEQMCCIYSSSNASLDKSNGNTVGTTKSVYDALVLTAKDDCDYVMLNIVSELKQNKSQIRIGMQHKNVSAAKLLTAAYQSRKLVIYLTNNFLQTEWSRPEIRSAVGNSWMPGKVILIQAPNLNLQSNTDRELFNNAGRGVVLLRTWEIDFSYKLAYAVETHPSHYAPPATAQQMPPVVMQHPSFNMPNHLQEIQSQNNQHQSYYSGGPMDAWKSITSKQMMMPYNIHYNEPQSLDKNDSYYSSATNTSILSRQFDKQTIEHVYIGIDSDYGSATNDEPTIHRATAQPPTVKHLKDGNRNNANPNNSGNQSIATATDDNSKILQSPKPTDIDELSI